MHKHLLNTPGVHDMRGFYTAGGMLATSTNSDEALIRSHIAYWTGAQAAERAAIKPSRGHTYRIAMYGKHSADDHIVKITDHFDHRDGVVGYAKLNTPAVSGLLFARPLDL